MIRSPYGEGSLGILKPLWEAEENGVDFLDFLEVATLEEARELDIFYVPPGKMCGCICDGRQYSR